MLHFVPRECRRFLRFGVYQMGERTLNLAGQHVDKLVIGILMGPVPLGYYDAASRLVQRPYQIINPVFTRVAYPVFSSVQKDRDRLRKGYLELMEVLSGLTIPVYAGMLALATPFILVQYGAKFLPTADLLGILCIAGLGFAITSPAGSLILACGRADVGFYLNVLRTALVLAGIWIGSRWGTTGIAWSLVVVVVTVMFPVHAYVRRRLVGMTLREFMATIWPYLWASAVSAAVAVAGQRFIAWPNALVELLVLLAASGCAYVWLLWWRSRARVMRIIRLARS
jgi:O-antigen/teichoic acid export membrane protein